MGVVRMNKEDIIIKNQQALERCIIDNKNILSKQIEELKQQQDTMIYYLEYIYRKINN